MEKKFKVLFLFVLLLGFLTTGIAQQVITTTTTTVLTIPGTTYVTTFEGGESIVTMIVPRYTMIIVEKYPDKTCTIVVKPLKPEDGMIEIPGTTVTVPGATLQTVITEPTIKYSTIYEEDGVTTTTGYTVIEFATTMYGQTFSMPFPIYAEIVSSCQTIQVLEEVTIIMGSVPATLYYAYPEMTYSFEGTTITLEGVEEIPLSTLTTITITPGTTYTETTLFPGTTISTVVTLPAGARTITEPEKTITSTITYVTTLPESTPKTVTTTPTTTTKSETSPTSIATTTSAATSIKTETTKPSVEAAGLPLEMIVGVVVVVAIVIIGVAVLLFRRSMSRIR
ncbi:MAG: hypothetical protein QXU28_03530 [Nitrososphaerota archaeon]